MPAFTPPHCPYPDCPPRPFLYRRRGTYTRACDGRVVPRFECLKCQRRFSSQSFRIDYRHRRPELNIPIAEGLDSKVTMRQLARMKGCNLKTVARRIPLFGQHFRELQRQHLAENPNKLGKDAAFVFDELETFEQNRIEKPLTVPIVVDGKTGFIIHGEVGMLPARRKVEGALPRPNESAEMVKRCLTVVANNLAPNITPHFVSDRKSVYQKALRLTMPGSYAHKRVPSTEQRDFTNPLFPINHLFAMLRDGISRLVRRNWAYSKKRERLLDHLWIYIGYRNYVRYITNYCQDLSPASAMGIAPRMYSLREALTWRGRIAL